MKLYTNESQTAKLIELGFEKPKSISSIKVTGDIITTAEDLIGEPPSVMGGKITANYSIGELIEILHQYIIPIEIHYEKGGFDYFHLSLKVYIDGMWITMMETRNVELIDFLFEGIVKLKLERVI